MDIVGGARKAEYGDQRVNFQKYADIATLMLDSADLEAIAGGRIPSAVVVKRIIQSSGWASAANGNKTSTRRTFIAVAR